MAILEPKAINPPVWLLSTLAIAIGCSYTILANAVRPSPPAAAQEQTIEVSEEPAREAEEQPTVQHDLGQCLYQYFAANSKHQAYFRLLQRKEELARYSAVNARDTYNLVPLTASDLTPYDEPPAGTFVAQVNKRNLILVDQIEQAEQTADQHHYLVIDLDYPNEPKARLEAGLNQFTLDHKVHCNKEHQCDNGHYQLVGCDQMDAWGQQPVSPKVIFDLNVTADKAVKLTLHKGEKHSTDALLASSKRLKEQFRDLDISEEVPITLAPVDLAKEMADLIYEGNGKQAKFLLAHAWPANRPGKNKFARAFYSELAKGIFNKLLEH